jgi:hypothetical protein
MNKQAQATGPKDAYASSVKPEVVVHVLFGYAIPRVHIERLISNKGPNLYEISTLDGYPVLQDHRVSRNNCKDKRVFVALPPVLEPWRLRGKPAHDGGFYSPKMWPQDEQRAALEAVLRKNMIWDDVTEENYGLHVCVKEGRM